MIEISDALVSRVRKSSRQLVRELGFMDQTLAGTGFHASVVHAIIEIGSTNDLKAKQLAQKLLLEKSTVSRIVKGLIARGEVTESRSPSDARAKHLALTGQGQKTLHAISAMAAQRVASALSQLAQGQAENVSQAMGAYADALTHCREHPGAGKRPADPEIVAGYEPGLIGAIVCLHATYYARETGFGAAFEATVAEGLAGFAPRLGNPDNQIWHLRRNGEFAGSIAIDGEDLGGSTAHLRWFIVSDAVRGAGAGRRLLSEALSHCDQRGFAETLLWTFEGLDAARRLYEANGFVLVEHYWGDQWSKQVREQRFVRPLGGGH